MKLLNINFILLFCFIQQLAFSQSLNENIISIYSKNPKDNTSQQWYVESIGDTVYTLGSYGIRAYDYKDKYNPYLMIENEEPSSYMKWARSLCGGDDVLFVATRQASGGEKERYAPNYRFRFENKIKDFTENTGDFDNFINDGNISVDEYGEPDMNYGVHSLRLVSNSNLSSQSFAILEKQGANVSSQKYGSLWIKICSLQNSDAVIPLRRNDDENVFAIKISPTSDLKFKILLSDKSSEDETVLFDKNTWYNIKFYIDDNTSKLWWRTKECGEWSILQEGTGIKEFNKISVGLITAESNASVLIDDYYCHSSNIDNVTYVNGSLEVLDKKTLNVINKYNTDIKLVKCKMLDSLLVVSGLRGFNIYNKKNEKDLELLYAHRESEFLEFQGLDFFKKDEKTYVVFSNYGSGISIWDISDPNNTIKIKDISFSGLNVLNYQIPSKKRFTFDLFVDYPYVYSTLSNKSRFFMTENDCRGLIVYDISNLKNVKAKVYLVNKEDCFSTVTADESPTVIRKQGDYIYVNMAERGLGVYKMEDEGEFTYLGLTSIYDGTAIRAFDIVDDIIYSSAFIGDSIFCVKNNMKPSLIKNIRAQNIDNKEIYDLFGRKVTKPNKGVYIINGKKFIIK